MGLSAFGNAAGLVSSNVFQAKDEPKYLPALIYSAAFGGAAILGVVGFGAYLRFDNARRDRTQGVKMKAGDVDTAGLRGGMEDPSFRYVGSIIRENSQADGYSQGGCTDIMSCNECKAITAIVLCSLSRITLG